MTDTSTTASTHSDDVFDTAMKRIAITAGATIAGAVIGGILLPGPGAALGAKLGAFLSGASDADG